MGTLAQEELQEYANYITGKQTFPPSTHFQILYSYSYVGKVYAKGRPRFSKSGHAYTPSNTREFEKKLSEYFLKTRSAIIMCPISIRIIIYDKLPKSFSIFEKKVAKHNFIYSTSGDLVDNKIKSIVDAGNSILYADDSQISKVSYVRKYMEFQGFHLELSRCGLSPAETHNLGNLLK